MYELWARNKNTPKPQCIKPINKAHKQQNFKCFWLLPLNIVLPLNIMLPLKVCFSKISPPFWPEWLKGHCPWCVVKLSNFVERISSWSCRAAILSDCAVWTSLSPSSLSRMTWNASRSAAVEVEALFLFAPLLGVDDYPAASASVSIGSPSS